MLCIFKSTMTNNMDRGVQTHLAQEGRLSACYEWPLSGSVWTLKLLQVSEMVWAEKPVHETNDI